MTDEEKAEEYIRTDGTNGEKMWEKIHKEFPKCIVVKTTKSKERLSELLLEYTKAVYLEGLAEGRKEKCFEQSKDGTIRPCEVMKENEELKDQLKNNPYVQLLQKEKSELAEDFAKQIEKMKCCQNCKNNTEENYLKCSECYRQLEEKKEGWFDKWEPAE